jgi:hypothetical protein
MLWRLHADDGDVGGAEGEDGVVENEGVQVDHALGDGGRVIPPMDMEYVRHLERAMGETLMEVSGERINFFLEMLVKIRPTAL